ncbi:hypothetical protein [Eubacterium coprostanoligenes]|nr:hypothetical protein [Eubacterium coprostanoligenes]MDY5399430.1 hypothetical protein [Eubacterium coprostanoligenes]
MMRSLFSPMTSSKEFPQSWLIHFITTADLHQQSPHRRYSLF